MTLVLASIVGACTGADSPRQPVSLGALDPILYVGQTATPAQLVDAIGGPMPSSLTLHIDSGDASSFAIAGSSLKALAPGGIALDVTDGGAGNATVQVGALYDTRGKWVLHTECPYLGLDDSVNTYWHVQWIRSDSTDYRTGSQPARLVYTAEATTYALATEYDSTFHVHYGSGGAVTGDTAAQTASLAFGVISSQVDSLRPGWSQSAGVMYFAWPLPVRAQTPLTAGDEGLHYCGEIASSGAPLSRETIAELRRLP
jgi:hypothetical protein